jgi:hypothetical protein
MRSLAICLIALTIFMQPALAQDDPAVKKTEALDISEHSMQPAPVQDEPKLKKTEASGISELSNSTDSPSFKSEKRSTVGNVRAEDKKRIRKESKLNEILLGPMVTAATVLVAGEIVWKLCQQELAANESAERKKQLQKHVEFPPPLP